MSAAISVENLSKAYRIGLKEEVPDSLVGALSGFVRNPFRGFNRLRKLDTRSQDGDAEDVVWALKDVSFEVEEGEVVGIIGRNGAGKSTLLKILSRITEPTSGRAVIRGRVSSLLEVGTGFHPELTGRENVYMNGTILGMTKREIDRKFDEIVDFSGVEKFLDTPVKRYSSGMQVRLAFAVAAHLEPEILIVDEVLAVGDAEFQRKCLGKMRDVARGGRTVLFVSHNMVAVERFCPRVCLLSNGALAKSGEVRSVLDMYFSSQPSGTHVNCGSLERASGLAPVVTSVRVVDAKGAREPSVRAGGGVTIEVEYEADRRLTNPRIGVLFETLREEPLFLVQTGIQSAPLDDVEAGDAGTVSCTIPDLPLAPGRYRLTIGISSDRLQVDLLPGVVDIEVLPSDLFGTGSLPSSGHGPFLVSAEWRSSNTMRCNAL